MPKTELALAGTKKQLLFRHSRIPNLNTTGMLLNEFIMPINSRIFVQQVLEIIESTRYRQENLK